MFLFVIRNVAVELATATAAAERHAPDQAE
jgi:hypothetical protein